MVAIPAKKELARIAAAAASPGLQFAIQQPSSITATEMTMAMFWLRISTANMLQDGVVENQRRQTPYAAPVAGLLGCEVKFAAIPRAKDADQARDEPSEQDARSSRRGTGEEQGSQGTIREEHLSSLDPDDLRVRNERDDSARGLLVDFGGVLTTNVFQSFRSFCEAEGLEANAFADLLRSSPETRAELRRLETAQISAEEFGAHLAPLLGVADADGLMARIFAGIGPEPAMVHAVRTARQAGIRTGLISNSVGTDIYDRAVLDELFDAIVISGEVGFHKPQPEIFLLGAEQVGLPPSECIFVDDLRENCAGAEAVGMTAVLHRGPDRTLPELERLLGVTLVGWR